jgi:hypothetical protein
MHDNHSSTTPGEVDSARRWLPGFDLSGVDREVPSLGYRMQIIGHELLPELAARRIELIARVPKPGLRAHEVADLMKLEWQLSRAVDNAWDRLRAAERAAAEYEQWLSGARPDDFSGFFAEGE